MYRVSKVMSNNSVIAIDMEDNQEYILVGKGLGFGKKVSERFEKPENAALYRLTEDTERGAAKALAQSIAPEFMEIADEVVRQAELMLGPIDHRILLPLADHISFAAARIRNGEQISNPLTDDIRALFYLEFKAASAVKEILQERLQLSIDEHEIGYVALHIHSALQDETISAAMQTARAVRQCVEILEKETGQRIDVLSLSYNRLMNHIKYMVMRALSGENLKLNMNDYIGVRYPGAYALAADICAQLGQSLGKTLDEMEIGYLAMHIERVYHDEEDFSREN